MAKSNLLGEEEGDTNGGGAMPTPLEEALGLTRKGTCARHPTCPVLVNNAVMSCRVCFTEEKSVGIRQRKNFAAVVNQLQTMGKGGDDESNVEGTSRDESSEANSIALQHPQTLESIMKRLEQVQNWMVRQKEKEVMSLQLTIQRLEERVQAQETTILEQKDTIRGLRKTIQHDLKIIKTMATNKERELEEAASVEAASVDSREQLESTIIITRNTSGSLLCDGTTQSEEEGDDDSESMLYDSPVRKSSFASSPSKTAVADDRNKSPSKRNSTGSPPRSSDVLGSTAKSPAEPPHSIATARSPQRMRTPQLDQQNIRRGTKKSAFMLNNGQSEPAHRPPQRHSSNMSIDASVTIPEETDDDDDDDDDDDEKLFVPPQQREYWSDEDLAFAKDPVRIFQSFRGGLLDIPRSPPPACHNKKQKLKLRLDIRNEAPPNMRRVQRSYSGVSDDGLIPLKAMAGNLSMLPSLDHSGATTPVNSVPGTPVSLADSTPSPKAGAGKGGPTPPAPPLSLLRVGNDDDESESDDKDKTTGAGERPATTMTSLPLMIPVRDNTKCDSSVLTETYSVQTLTSKDTQASSSLSLISKDAQALFSLSPTLPVLREEVKNDNAPKPAKTYNVTRVNSRDKFGDPGVYTGSLSVNSGLPHGKGSMNYESGRVYEGEWLSGHWNGKGRLLNPNGDVYEGEFVFDARHGQGTYKWDNGDIYVGSFSQDKRHGKGKFSFHNGNVYEGEFCDGMFEGYGRYEFSGGYYEGEWKHGRYDGNGELVYSSGAKYTGEFRNSVAHGFGMEVAADGQKRRGCWENGQPVQ